MPNPLPQWVQTCPSGETTVPRIINILYHSPYSFILLSKDG